PVGGGKVKGPFKHPAISRSRTAIAHGMEGDLIDWRLRNKLIGDPGAIGIDQSGARRPLVFWLFVTFDSEFGIVLRLALFPRNLDAVNATVTRVQQLEIVDIPIGTGNAIWGIGAGTVDEQGNKELVLGQPRSGTDEANQHSEADCYPQRLALLHKSPFSLRLRRQRGFGRPVPLPPDTSLTAPLPPFNTG